MKKFYIKTLGCKTNMIEGQVIAESLLNCGFLQVQKKEEADIFILNSCTVTGHSDNQALYLIKQIRKENPSVKVVLAGCGAQTMDLNSVDADLILGNKEKLEIEKYINELFSGSKNSYVQDIFKEKNYFGKNLLKTASTRPPVKIQDGCNNRCSYCLIPFARGNSRSDSIENIIKQINIHALNGRKEIVLTGIHIGQWGLDLNLRNNEKQTLLTLLKEIEKSDILRFRLGSLYINEIDDSMFEFLINSKKFCPHFHLSLQSMCDKTLKNMNRFYTKKDALCVIEKIHKNFDLPFIGCDIITGFPFETREDFLETKEALIEAKVSYIHSFPYSKRKGTRAYDMENQNLEHVKKERTKELIEVCSKLHGKFLNANKNKIRTVLFEKKGKNGLYSGVTENYIKVYKKSDENLQNTLYTVNLAEFEELY